MRMRRPLRAFPAMVLVMATLATPLAAQQAGGEDAPALWRRWVYGAAGAVAAGLPLLLLDDTRAAGWCSTAACSAGLSAAAGGVVGFIFGRSADRKTLERWRVGPDLEFRADQRKLRFPPRRLLPQADGAAVVLGSPGLAAVSPGFDVVSGGDDMAGLNGAALFADRAVLLATTGEGLFAFELDGASARLGGSLLPLRATAVGPLGSGALLIGTSNQLWRIGLREDAVELGEEIYTSARGEVRAVAPVEGGVAWTLEGPTLVGRDPHTLRGIGRLELPADARTLATDGRHAAVCTSAAEVVLIAVGEPGQPRQVAVVRPEWIHRIENAVVRGARLYLAAGAQGLLVYDVSVPTRPERIGVVRAGSVDDVALARGGDLLLLDREAQRIRRVHILDLAGADVARR